MQSVINYDLKKKNRNGVLKRQDIFELFFLSASTRHMELVSVLIRVKEILQ